MEIKPLRVLQVVGGLGPGGIESFLMSVYRQIDRNKVQFDFMVPEEVEYHYSHEVRELGGRIYPIHYGKKDYLKSNRRLREFYEKMGYKVVHLHLGHLHSMQALDQAKSAGIPVRVLHAHCAGWPLDSPRDLLNACVHAFNRHRISSATDYFACSTAAADFFGFGDAGKGAEWKTVLNGINVGKYAYDRNIRTIKRDELGFSCEDTVIGTVGRMESEKNQSLLLRAFPLIKEKIPTAKLLIVGDGSQRTALLGLMEELSIANDCVLLSGRRDVAELCSAMDAFAFPSILEGLGIALIEAEANGLPCVASSGVPSEAIITTNCRVCSVENGGDLEEWAEAVVSAVKIGRLENAPEQVAAAGFSVKKTAEQLEEFYLSSIERQ